MVEICRDGSDFELVYIFQVNCTHWPLSARDWKKTVLSKLPMSQLTTSCCLSDTRRTADQCRTGVDVLPGEFIRENFQEFPQPKSSMPKSCESWIPNLRHTTTWLEGCLFLFAFEDHLKGTTKTNSPTLCHVQTQYKDCIVLSPEALHGFERSTCSKSWLVSEIPPNGKIRLEILRAAKAHHPNLAATPSASLRSAVGGKMLCTFGHLLNPNCKWKEWTLPEPTLQVPLILFEVYANLDQDRTFWCVASGAMNTHVKCHVPANKDGR